MASLVGVYGRFMWDVSCIGGAIVLVVVVGVVVVVVNGVMLLRM
jgi:hypothetical protein